MIKGNRVLGSSRERAGGIDLQGKEKFLSLSVRSQSRADSLYSRSTSLEEGHFR